MFSARSPILALIILCSISLSAGEPTGSINGIEALVMHARSATSVEPIEQARTALFRFIPQDNTAQLARIRLSVELLNITLDKLDTNSAKVEQHKKAGKVPVTRSSVELNDDAPSSLDKQARRKQTELDDSENDKILEVFNTQVSLENARGSLVSLLAVLFVNHFPKGAGGHPEMAATLKKHGLSAARVESVMLEIQKKLAPSK